MNILGEVFGGFFFVNKNVYKLVVYYGSSKWL